MCAAKELPTLTGHRFKTRKRDEKVKYDAEAFADSIISRLNETDGSVDALSSVLDNKAGELDYRRYSEALLETLIAGGILAPGGKVESDPPANYCVFTATPTVTSVKSNVQVLSNLLRRYRYLQKQIKECISKVITYLKAFTESQRQCLAMYTALCISEGILTQDVINSLFTGDLFAEHLVKDEALSLPFTIVLFRTWIAEKGIMNVGSVLRKVKLEDQLLNILPLSRRTEDNFDKHFSEAGLSELVTFRRAQQNIRIKRKLKDEIDEYLKNDTDAMIVIDHCQEIIDSSTLTDIHVVALLWSCVMNMNDWNRTREDLLPQLLEKHLEKYSSYLEPFCDRGTAQLILLREIQSYCLQYPNLVKLFHKIVIHFYTKDLLSEQAILKWYDNAYLPEKKELFLNQMKKMVDWLLTAEEESDHEDHTGEATRDVPQRLSQ